MKQASIRILFALCLALLMVPAVALAEGTASHRVTVEPVTNGSVTGAPETAAAGATVTLTAKGADFYGVDTLSVRDAQGAGLVVSDLGGGNYSFVMPDGDVVISATFAHACPSRHLVDVLADGWYHGDLDYVVDRKLMYGVAENLFEPESPTTRGMVVTTLHRLEGLPSAPEAWFTDVNTSDWYGPGVNWAAANGIVNGVSATSYEPDTAVSREQIAAILYRYTQFKGRDVSGTASLSGYIDSGNIMPYAVTAMGWANHEGFIIGDTANTLNPQGTVTRAQLATILARVSRSGILPTTEPDNQNPPPDNQNTGTGEQQNPPPENPPSDNQNTGTGEQQNPPPENPPSDNQNTGADEQNTNTDNQNTDTDDQNTQDDSFTVSFDLNYSGAPAAQTQKVEKGKTAERPEKPTRSGYYFVGWYSDASLTTVYDFSEEVTRDITLYARWMEMTGMSDSDSDRNEIYYVYFNYRGDSGSMLITKQVTAGQTTAPLPDPVRTGYVFEGWYTGEFGGTKFDFTQPITSNVRLYAHWAETGSDMGALN